VPPQIVAVVKANAYGHGAERVALALESAGASVLACADIEEGITLRRAGVRVPILVFGALSVSDVDGVFECALTPTISSPAAARALQAAAARHHDARLPPEDRHGMNRSDSATTTCAARCPACSAARTCGSKASSPLCDGRRPRAPFFDQQRERFERVADGRLARIRGCRRTFGPARVLRHAANSAAMLRDSRVWYDMVRPGLLLYGIVPPPLATTIPLVPVLSLTSRVVAVKGRVRVRASGMASGSRPTRRPRSRSFQPATRTASTCACPDGVTCSSADDGRPSWAPSAWT
jgi:alanine racemase